MARPWQDPALGVPLPDGASRLVVTSPDIDLESVDAMFVDADGGVLTIPGEGPGDRVVVDLAGSLPPDTRLAGLRTGAEVAVGDQPSIGLRASVRVDGEEVARTGRLSNPGSGSWLMFGDVPDLPAAVPALLTDDLASGAALAVGDTDRGARSRVVDGRAGGRHRPVPPHHRLVRRAGDCCSTRAACSRRCWRAGSPRRPTSGG